MKVLELFCGTKSISNAFAAPDCTTYSVAAISYHRRREPDGNLKAITAYAQQCDIINAHVVQLIKELNPRYWFIENPRGGMRKMDFMQDLPRYTVTYCKYGETRMKPTDIWTNHPQPNFIPPCKNGDKCHEAAPRGARTGTQKIKTAKDRSRIPDALCRHNGHEVYTVDWEKGFNPTLCVDIGTLTVEKIIDLCGGVPDVIWASIVDICENEV